MSKGRINQNQSLAVLISVFISSTLIADAKGAPQLEMAACRQDRSFVHGERTRGIYKTVLYFKLVESKKGYELDFENGETGKSSCDAAREKLRTSKIFPIRICGCGIGPPRFPVGYVLNCYDISENGEVRIGIKKNKYKFAKEMVSCKAEAASVESQIRRTFTAICSWSESWAETGGTYHWLLNVESGRSNKVEKLDFHNGEMSETACIKRLNSLITADSFPVRVCGCSPEWGGAGSLRCLDFNSSGDAKVVIRSQSFETSEACQDEAVGLQD